MEEAGCLNKSNKLSSMSRMALAEACLAEQYVANLCLASEGWKVAYRCIQLLHPQAKLPTRFLGLPSQMCCIAGRQREA